MPGTVGTLFGWLVFHVFTLRWPDIMTPQTWAWVIVIGFIVGVWTCEKTGRALGVADHGAIVWDEIIAIWLVMLLVTPASFIEELWAFLVFRAFDMIKPPQYASLSDDTRVALALWQTISSRLFLPCSH